MNEKAEKMKQQLGVVRTNCIDCLDRTNVTQVDIHFFFKKMFHLVVFSTVNKHISLTLVDFMVAEHDRSKDVGMPT